MDLFVSAAELKSSLDSDILIIDGRPFSEYSKSHIPGAVNIDLMQFHWIDTSNRGIQEFNHQTQRLLSNIGVSQRRRVVFYDNQSGMSAARGVWLLLYFSHRNVAMLDGGISGWKKRGYRTAEQTEAFRHSKFDGDPNRGILATYSDVRRASNDRKSVIIDTRSADEYNGRVVRAFRRGHIPGSINIDWAQNLKGNSLKKQNELEHLYSRFSKDAQIITYCQGGYRAANTFVVLKDLGYTDVRMYLGSWGEWGNRPELPVES